EPWHLGEEVVSVFRKMVEIRYRLIPFLYTQAVLSSRRGLPMIRPIFMHFPEDPTSWCIEDQYLLGEHLLVAPLFDSKTERKVYLPENSYWINYLTGTVHKGGKWHNITANEIPGILLVKSGVIIPHAALAQHTRDIDWSKLYLKRYTHEESEAAGNLALPSTKKEIFLQAVKHGQGGWKMKTDTSGMEFIFMDDGDRLNDEL
ncbi:MAG: TIM-barrel domain-containing protein, partial [Bacteroidota bacterium]